VWICLNDAFFSIVDEKAANFKRNGAKVSGTDVMLVRARRAEDLRRTFGESFNIIETPSRDYHYRIRISRSALAQVIGKCVLRIDYGNFKNSVTEDDRHDAYGRIWHVMHAFQTKPVNEDFDTPLPMDLPKTGYKSKRRYVRRY